MRLSRRLRLSSIAKTLRHKQMNPTRGRKSRDQRRIEDLDALLQRTTPQFTSFYVEEPRLVFGGGQTAVDPKSGISSFGPIGSDPSSTKSIRLGIVGTGAEFRRCNRILNKRWRK